MTNPEEFPEIKIHKEALDKLEKSLELDLSEIKKGEVLEIHTKDGSVYRFENIKKPSGKEKRGEYKATLEAIKSQKIDQNNKYKAEIWGSTGKEGYQKNKLKVNDRLIFGCEIEKGKTRMIKTPAIDKIEKISKEA